MTNQPGDKDLNSDVPRGKSRGPLSDNPQRQRRQRNDRSATRTSPTRPAKATPEEEPICVLKVELDAGENV